MKTETLIKIWCEYDIGQYYVIFPDIPTAREWLSNKYQEMLDNGVIYPGQTYETLEYLTILGFETVTLITEV